MLLGSMRTSTRFTATRLPNRFVICVASRTVMLTLALWRQIPRQTGGGNCGACVRWHARAPGLTQLQCCRLAFTDRDKLAVLDLGQGPLLDGITRVLAIGTCVDDGDLAIGTGKTGKVFYFRQLVPHLLAILLQALGGVLDFSRSNGLGQHLHRIVAVCRWPVWRFLR